MKSSPINSPLRPPQDFALGDFDESPIAQMEAEKEEAAEGAGTLDIAANSGTARRDVGEEDADEQDGVEVAAWLRLPEEKASAARKENRKSLIEEL